MNTNSDCSAKVIVQECVEGNSKRNVCHLCSNVLAEGSKLRFLTIYEPLPSSCLSSVRLLRLFGISCPVPHKHSSNVATIPLCAKCYSLLMEADSVYQILFSLASQIRKLWAKHSIGPGVFISKTSESEFTDVNTGCSQRKGETLNESVKFDTSSNKQGVFQAPVVINNVNRTYIPILSKPVILPNDSVQAGTEGTKSQNKETKQVRKEVKNYVCGLCGSGFDTERTWLLHIRTVHRIHQKWFDYSLQTSLKQSIRKELLQIVIKPRDKKKTNSPHDNADTVYKCSACDGGNFRVREQFIEHLHHHHNLDVEDNNCSGISDSSKWTVKPHEIKNTEKTTTSKCDVIVQHEDTAVSGSELLWVEAEDDPLVDVGDVDENEGLEGERKDVEESDISTWSCEICSTEFAYHFDLEEHMKIAHRDLSNRRKSKRGQASRLLNTKTLPSRALTTSKVKLKCKFCSQVLNGQKELKRHVQSTHESCVITLDSDGDCGVMEYRISEASPSSPSITDAKNESNHKALKTSTPAKANVSPKAKTGRAVCNTCGDRFPNNLLLLNHKEDVHNVVSNIGRNTLHECEYCGLKVRSLFSLNQHITKVHHNVPTKKASLKHQCNLCLFQSRTRHQFEKHLRKKHGVEMAPPVECKFCGKSVTAKYIDVHIANIHENKKKYLCDYCPMKFNTLTHVNNHIYLEHVRNSWKCELCQEEFTKYHQLRQHRLYVHPKKIHHCTLCGKTFKRKGDLTEHGKRQHMEKVRSECSYCSKTYCDRRKLRLHLMNNHGVAWKDTLSKRYARLQQESNCLRLQSGKNSTKVQQLTGSSPEAAEKESSHNETQIQFDLYEMRQQEAEHHLRDQHESTFPRHQKHHEHIQHHSQSQHHQPHHHHHQHHHHEQQQQQQQYQTNIEYGESCMPQYQLQCSSTSQHNMESQQQSSQVGEESFAGYQSHVSTLGEKHGYGVVGVAEAPGNFANIEEVIYIMQPPQS